MQLTAAYLHDAAHDTGGWRCNFTKFGRGPETVCANPGATLFVLDTLRYTGHTEAGPIITQAVESLLDHWKTRKPCGPCHYGIGSKFMQVEYPFLRYNLFYYMYVLSFYPSARNDKRIREALVILQSKLDSDGQLVVEAPHRGLKGLTFCAKGEPSELATHRYQEIIENMRS